MPAQQCHSAICTKKTMHAPGYCRDHRARRQKGKLPTHMGAKRIEIGGADTEDAFFIDVNPPLAQEGKKLLDNLDMPTEAGAGTIKVSAFMISGDMIECTASKRARLKDVKQALCIAATSGFSAYSMLLFTGDDEEPVPDDTPLKSFSSADIHFFLVLAENERSVLADFFTRCSGSKWLTKTNWMSDAPLSDWQHLLFTQKDLGAVLMTASLSHNNLRDNLPQALTALKVLRTLNLSHSHS
jgi:hypothetical protein